MKTRITILTLAALGMLLSCSQPLPVEGEWQNVFTTEETGCTITVTSTMNFTPTDKKSGTVIMKAITESNFDRMGILKANTTIPGTYTIHKNNIIIQNDTSAVKSSTAFHPTSFLGSLSSDYFDQLDEDYKKSIGEVPVLDTLKQVTIKEDKLTFADGKEMMTFTKVAQ